MVKRSKYSAKTLRFTVVNHSKFTVVNHSKFLAGQVGSKPDVKQSRDLAATISCGRLVTADFISDPPG